MKRRVVIEVESESYMEEQFLIDKFPDAIWHNEGGNATFYISIDENERVLKALTLWKEMEDCGFTEEI